MTIELGVIQEGEKNGGKPYWWGGLVEWFGRFTGSLTMSKEGNLGVLYVVPAAAVTVLLLIGSVFSKDTACDGDRDSI